MDYTNFTDITATKNESAYDASKWVEVSNIACPMALGVSIPRTVHEHCDYADALAYAGHTDWRLANAREMLELLFFANISTNTTLLPTVLGVTATAPFHSSTPYHVAPTIKNIVSNFVMNDFYTPLLAEAYNDNWAYGIYVRNIA